MAKRQTDEKQSEEQRETPTGTDRRSFIKTAGVAAAAATVFGTGALAGGVSAASGSVDSYLSKSGDVQIPAGTYSWSGSGIGVASGDSLVGDGTTGDVVWNLDSGTMDGYVKGTMKNIVVRGHNHQTKAGIDVYPGATIDGFVWPEGGQQPEDRAFYSPSGGSEPATIRNAAWAWMSNNGAYTDKPAMQYENCAAINNNITGIRVGQRDGTPSSATTNIKNCLIAITKQVKSDGSNSANARGIRMRHPGNFVIENCWFIYLDVPGAANPIEIHDGAAGSNVTIRNCHFYNDSSQAIIRDKSNGGANVTIENCTVEGSGSTTVEPSFSGSGFSNASASYPLPSQVTGFAVADEIDGVGAGIGPWTQSGANVQTDSANATSGNSTTNATNGNSTTSDPANSTTSDPTTTTQSKSTTTTSDPTTTTTQSKSTTTTTRGKSSASRTTKTPKTTTSRRSSGSGGCSRKN